MSVKYYKGDSLEKCINQAVEELKISKDELKYTVVEKKGFFKKTYVISVEASDEETVKTEETNTLGENDGSVWVNNGKIFVKNAAHNGRPPVVIPSEGMILMVNGEEVKRQMEVKGNDDIECIIDKTQAKRYLNVKITDDKIEAYVDVEYKPETLYKLKDVEKRNKLLLEKEVLEENYPDKFTEEEIKQELSNLGVKYGIIQENISKAVEGTKGALLIAKGVEKIDDTDDEIKYLFKSSAVKTNDDSLNDRVDYKNMNSIDSVEKGAIIAEHIPGETGQDGIDVYGNKIPKIQGKRKPLKTGKGCIPKGENAVMSLVNGKPSTRNGVLSVNEVHEVTGDVDIKNGNVKFVGDVNITGDVQEGMVVEAGNNVTISKNINGAKVRADGNVYIKGNIIASNVTAGGADVIVQRRIKDLSLLKETLKNIELALNEIKDHKLLGTEKQDGEIIKLLIDSKFRTILRTCIQIINDYSYDESNGQSNGIVNFIKQKLIGLGPLSIKHVSEFDVLLQKIDEKLDSLNKEAIIPVVVEIAYSQDSTVSSSGDVIITGNGEYVSNISAYNSIQFTDERAIARGGTLTAGNQIRCKTVGSSAGVTTVLQVEKTGNIWASTVYQNTRLIVGTREFVVDMPCRELHAYLDKEGDLAVDKFNL
ncbi:DUF342 domain-containing protein [Clostridium oryzae]|uniref:RNA-binding protein KhpB N-terminal domain-containing protein n=1 Tax=Clostridium oryzae TaxID=1450648 RepID=A0A1V4IM12_9CLOT|nr:flagellar assembly protein A [Clostridium oryzae]OPJ60860.1 hypothetical protein CLORY_25670 [Clostridium oryzae]